MIIFFEVVQLVNITIEQINYKDISKKEFEIFNLFLSDFDKYEKTVMHKYEELINLEQTNISEVKKFFNRCEKNKILVFKILLNDSPIGFVTMWKSTTYKDTVHIKQFFLMSKFRNLGYGSKVLNLLELKVKQLYPDVRFVSLNVSAGNTPSRKFYKKNEFQEVGIFQMKKI